MTAAVHPLDRQLAALLLMHSARGTAHALAPADEHPGASASDGEALLAGLFLTMPREHIERPLSYLQTVLEGEVPAVRAALAGCDSPSARLDDRRLRNALLHVRFCLVLRLGRAEPFLPGPLNRLRQFWQACRAGLRARLPLHD